MSVVVEPLIGRTISSIISMTYGPILGLKEADIMNHFQRMGEVYAGYVDDQLVCFWGLMPPSFLSMSAYLWMWCADSKVPHQLVFIRQSQIQVQRMLEKYSSIHGHTEIGNRKAIRWLKWLGAEFTDYPEDGKLPFVIQRKSNG
jgi:hypothetical protein